MSQVEQAYLVDEQGKEKGQSEGGNIKSFQLLCRMTSSSPTRQGHDKDNMHLMRGETCATVLLTIMMTWQLPLATCRVPLSTFHLAGSVSTLRRTGGISHPDVCRVSCVSCMQNSLNVFVVAKHVTDLRKSGE